MIFDFIYEAVQKLTPATSKFIMHNQRIFKKVSRATKQKPLVLFELNKMHSAHISYSYLANVLSADCNAQIKGFGASPPGLLQSVLSKIKGVKAQKEFAVYKSFGASGFINLTCSSSQEVRAQELLTELFSRLNIKQDIEALDINGVLVGDLFYDTYLRKYSKPTINKESADFKDSFLKSVKKFVFWEEFFNENDVRAINVSHCVYDQAIPLRIAVEKNIPVFQVSATHVYRLNKKNLFAYNDFFYFRERFKNLPQEVQIAGIAEAKKRINRRFQGEVGVDMAYSTKSAYSASRHSRLLKESHRKKILIATHCFFDSPHSYGDNIFPDFYEWLDFLGKMTKKTDYDWYIKTHPDYLPGTKEVIDSFIVKYPKLTLLPSDASHHQIISEGIDLTLTVHGTIAFEYAALGIPVINASQNNPHIAYDFNLHAKDVEDYRRMLIGLDKIDFTIDRQQVYEYYFMRHIFNTESIFFNNYEEMLEEIGGYSEQFTPVAYEKWMDEWNQDKHSAIISALSSFIQSGDFRMDYRHFGGEFSMDYTGAKE